MLSSSAPRATRRHALAGLAAGAAAGVGLSACGVLSQREPAGATPDGSASEGAGVDDAEVDASLLDQAVATTQEGLALLTATSERHPGLGGALEDLAAMHTAHLRVLARSLDDDPAAAPDPAVPARPPLAMRDVRRFENRCQTRLAELAGQARSGSFARLLASMAAATGQQVLQLPRPRDVGSAA